VMARIHAARGGLEDAIKANTRAIDLAGRAATSWRAHLISLHAQVGRADEARTALRQLENDLARQNERVGTGHLAYVHLALGDRKTALDLLERAADDRDPDVLWLAVDPRVDPLRSEPRLRALLARLGFTAPGESPLTGK
jgi:Flp pilus assembly protein TadD